MKLGWDIYLVAVLKALAAAGVIVMAISLSGCGGVSHGPNTEFKTKVAYKRLIVFGDSIGVGVGTSSPTKLGYAYQIAFRDGLEIVNLAVSGSKAEDASNAIKSFSFQPGDKVVWLSGYNDMRANGLDPDSLDNYYLTMLSALMALYGAGVDVNLGTCLRMLPESYGIGSIGQNQGSDLAAVGYANALHEAARSFPEIRVIDTTTLWVPGRNNLNSDLQHPNDLGAAQLAELFN